MQTVRRGQTDTGGHADMISLVCVMFTLMYIVQNTIEKERWLKYRIKGNVLRILKGFGATFKNPPLI